MAKLQYEQCLGCGNTVPMILDTTGLYMSKCWWCGCAMAQVHGIIRHAQTALPAPTETPAPANA